MLYLREEKNELRCGENRLFPNIYTQNAMTSFETQLLRCFFAQFCSLGAVRAHKAGPHFEIRCKDALLICEIIPGRGLYGKKTKVSLG